MVAGVVVDLGDASGGDRQLPALGVSAGVDEAEVEGGAAAVAGDLQHVVLGGVDGPVADAFGTGGEVGDVVGERIARFDHDRLGLVACERRGREVEVLGGADVGDLPVEGEQLGDVLEAGEAGLHPVGAAVGGELEGGVGAPEGRGPRVEGPQVDLGEQVGVQVGLHHPQLGHRVRHRRRRRERDDPWAVGPAERPQLGVEVLGPLRAGSRDAVDRRVDPPVLVGVGLVTEHVVDAGLLEADAVVLGVLGEEPLVGLLHLGDAALEPLHRQALAVLRHAERPAGRLDLLAEVAPHELPAEREASEPRLGEHDPVPVPRRRTGDELLAAVLREALTVGDEDAGRRVELKPLPRELLEHVVRDHDRRLGDRPEAAQLHRRDHHRGGLAGADGVGEQGPAVGEDPGHGVALVGAGHERSGEAGQGEVRPVVGRQHRRREQLVVAVGEAGRALGVFPHPRREPVRERLLLVAGGEGLGVVADPPAVLGGVGDGVEALVERGVEQRDAVGSGGPPLRGQRDAAARAVAQPCRPLAELGEALDVDGGAEHLGAEPFDVGGRDPRGAEPGGDLGGFELAGQDPFERGHVDGEVGALVDHRMAGVELLADVARQVLRRGDEGAVGGVLVDQLPQLGAGRVVVGAEQLGDPVERDGAGLVEADGDRFVGGVDAEPFGRWVDDPVGEDRRGPGLLGLVVEHLEGGDERPVGVVTEAAHAGPHPAHHLDAGGRVVATGPGLGRPVDGAVEPHVRLVPLGQGHLRGSEVGVIGAVDLDGEHGAGGVAQSDEAAELGRVLRDAGLVGDDLVADELTDLPVRRRDEAALLRVGQCRTMWRRSMVSG